MQVMVSKVYQAVAIHGCIGDESIVYIGGKDKSLMTSIEQLLTKANFKVAKAPDHLSGKHDDNIINYTQQNAGVQLELTTALRQSFLKIISLIENIVKVEIIGITICMHLQMLSSKLLKQVINNISVK